VITRNSGKVLEASMCIGAVSTSIRSRPVRSFTVPGSHWLCGLKHCGGSPHGSPA
jgi:hypothetical protein